MHANDNDPDGRNPQQPANNNKPEAMRFFDERTNWEDRDKLTEHQKRLLRKAQRDARSNERDDDRGR